MSTLGLHKLHNLPADVFLRVAAHLDIEDILALRKTCSTLYSVTKLKHLWFGVIENNTTSHKTLAKRCKPVAELSSSRLETLARHINDVDKILTSGKSPKLYMKLDRPRSVTWVHLLGGRWLLAASSDASVSEVSLWSLCPVGEEPAACRPTATAFLGGPVADGLVDDEGDRIVIALEIRSTDAYAEILGLSVRKGVPAFVRLARLPGVSRIRCLSGSRLGLALYDEVSIPCIIDWRMKEVARLRDTPDVNGGCVAMTVRGDCVALVTPMYLEIHVQSFCNATHSAQYRLYSKVALPMTFTDAAATFCDIAVSPLDRVNSATRRAYVIRLCLAAEGIIHVYDAAVPLNGGAVLSEVWSYPPTARGDTTRPQFGQNPQTVTWFDGPCSVPWRYVAFTTATLPTPEPSSTIKDPSTVTVYSFSDPSAPALHSMGVRDYDENLGLLVLGNACGELSVYDLVGHGAANRTSCLRDVPIPCADEVVEWMPTQPESMVSAAPYPYSALGPGLFGEPSPEMYAAVESRCAAERPRDVPQDWIIDGFANDDANWAEFVPVVGENIAWEMERSTHFLGTPIPLMFNPGQMVTLFKAGGLWLGYFEQADSILVFRPGVSASEAARAIDEGRVADISVAQVTNKHMCSSEGYRYFILWEWEKFTLGRNRWRELKERGGEVAPVWLNDRLLLGNNSVQVGIPSRVVKN